MTDLHEEDERGISPVVALYSILGFWLFYVTLVTLRSYVMGFEAQGPMATRRVIVTLIGIVVTWGLYLVIRRFDGDSLTRRIIVAFSAAIPCSILIALANYYVFYFYDPAGIFPDLPQEKILAEQGYALKEIAEFAIGSSTTGIPNMARIDSFTLVMNSITTHPTRVIAIRSA